MNDEIARPAKKMAYLDRAQRIERQVHSYLPGITRARAAEMAHVEPHEIIKLSSNENPLGPPPKAKAAVSRLLTDIHEYPSPTATELRTAIGRYQGVAAEQVVVGAGSSTLMHSIVDAFSSPGGEIVSLDPSFSVYSEIAVIHGRSPITVQLREDDFLLDLDRLVERINANTHIVFLTRPNNPTSTLIPLDVFVQAVEAAAEVGALVVSDEAYIEFADEPIPTALELIRGDRWTMPNVMVTRTFSKAYGLANLRLGYAIATAEAAHCLALANAKWPTGAVAQEAGIAALEDHEHFEKTLAVVASGRSYLAEAFPAIGLPVAPHPQGNYVMVDVRPSGMDATAFAHLVFERSHILIRGDFDPRFVRVSIGLPEENGKLIACADEILKAARHSA